MTKRLSGGRTYAGYKMVMCGAQMRFHEKAKPLCFQGEDERRCKRVM